MSSIPLSNVVNVTPAVLAGAGASLGMNAIILTENPLVPVGTLQGMAPSAAADFFGATALETTLASIYGAGYAGGSQTPSLIYFAQYNASAVGAWLRGATLSLTLAQLQALSGDIILEIDGRNVTSAAINLASATSFTEAATLVQTGLQTQGGIFNGTIAVTSASAQLTVSAVTSGLLHIGDTITDADGAIPAGTTITAFGTGTGGIGTYTLSAAATATNASESAYVSSTATVSYNTQLAAFEISSSTVGVTSSIAYPTDTSLSPSLKLTQAAEAIISAGAAAATPATVMDAIQDVSQDWASFLLAFDPDDGAAGGPIKLEFAQWNAAQDDAYAFIAWDVDPAPGSTAPDASCFAALAADLEGTVPIWDTNAVQAAGVAAFIAGTIASINFNAPNGRVAFDAKGSPSLTPDVTSNTQYTNALANGYNAYGAFASRTSAFSWLEKGSMTGTWAWIDSYVNQIYWNATLQEALATYKASVGFIPYNTAGYTGVRQALLSTIVAMGSFGAWQANVALSTAEIQAANQDAGISIGSTLQTQGWYLLVADPGATVRAARGSPIIKLYYVDGGSVQSLDMTSVDVE